MISVLNSISPLGAENALSSTQAPAEDPAATLDRIEDQLRIGRRSRPFDRERPGCKHLGPYTVQPERLERRGLCTDRGWRAFAGDLLVESRSHPGDGSLDRRLDDRQATAADTEYQSILTEIGNIGSQTNFNGTAIFSATAMKVYTSDGTAAGNGSASIATGTLPPALA